MPSTYRPHAVDPAATAASHFQPVLAPPAPLPRPLTPLVGREHEVTAVRAALAQPQVRLVTLTGPGGAGKSRVAIEAATSLDASFPEGVRLVRLAAVRDPALILPTVISSLGIPEAPHLSPLASLQSALRDRLLLLILDNFEQVIEAAPAIADLLRACPGVKALVTSRQRLRLRGERVIAIEPLPLPAADVADGEALLRNPAVDLFVQRAGDASPKFMATAANVAAIAEIVRRLDGLPLAIELAAARVDVLAPDQLAARLSQRLPLLTHGPRDLPDRLRTMRDAIAWSYDLLPPHEQRLFRHLAVFAGGFSMPAAEAIAAAERGELPVDVDELTLPTVMGDLAALTEKNLIRQAPNSGADLPPRFAMLETVREFGLERLAATGKERWARREHARYFRDLAERAWPDLVRWTAQDAWFDRFESEHDNLRAALEFLLVEEPEGAVELAGALLWFWHNCGHRGEGRQWLRRALAVSPDAPNAARARAIFAAALLAHWQDDATEAMPLFQECLTRWRALGDGWGERMSLLFLGIVSADLGDWSNAIPSLEASLALSRAANDDGLAAYALTHLAVAVWGRGDAQRAVRLFSEALAIHRRRGDPVGTNMALVYLCLIAAEQNAAADARTHLAESVALCRTITAREEIAFCLGSAAVLADAFRERHAAARLLGAHAALREALGNPAKLPESAAYGKAEAQARAALGERAFATAWANGNGLPVQQALDIAEAIAASEPASVAPVDGLTPRELEVLRLVAAGRTNAELAAELFITAGTARIHVSNILGKLGARTRTEAVAIARERALI